MPPKAMRLSPQARRGVRIAGIVLTSLGGLLFLTGFLGFASGPAGPGMGAPSGFRQSFFGLLLLAPGVWLLRLGYVGAYAGVVATETEGAVEVAAGAVGRGLRDAGGVGMRPEVKVRCRACGYLESEDADWCSRCRAGTR